MKKVIVLASLVGTVLFFNACTPTYVRKAPTHYDDVRPPSPSNNHIWIGENWVWSRQSRSYHPKQGYWSIPKRNRSYQQGHWKTNRGGNRWVRGKWR